MNFCPTIFITTTKKLKLDGFGLSWNASDELEIVEEAFKVFRGGLAPPDQVLQLSLEFSRKIGEWYPENVERHVGVCVGVATDDDVAVVTRRHRRVVQNECDAVGLDWEGQDCKKGEKKKFATT